MGKKHFLTDFCILKVNLADVLHSDLVLGRNFFPLTRER